MTLIKNVVMFELHFPVLVYSQVLLGQPTVIRRVCGDLVLWF